MRKIAAAILLTIFAVAALVSQRLESVTFDETAHIPAGLSYLQRHDLRMNPEHPPLAKAWSAIPSWLQREEGLDYDSAEWRSGDQWNFGYRSLQGGLHRPARTMMVLLGLGLGVLVWRWATELHGSAGGLLALTLFALSPTMLAHTRLVTTDLPAALGYTLTLWLLHRYTRRPGWRRAGLAGAGLGLALGIKFSAILLAPILLLWLLLFRTAPWRAMAGHVAVLALTAWAVLWAAYGFRYTAVPDGSFALPWEPIMAQEFAGKGMIAWLSGKRLLPEGWLYGLAYALGGAVRRLSYFRGELAVTGRALFFPAAFLLKTPPATIALLAWAAVRGIRRAGWRSRTGWFLAIPALVYLAVAVLGNLNIGHRHLAPLYPLMFIAIGSLAEAWSRPAARRALAGLLILAAGSFALATPRYLSYFNLLAGGGKHGERWFVDSSLDWGQDLPRLKKWMDREGVRQVDLAYFGTADPGSYGIDYRKVVLVHDFRPQEPAVRPGSGRWFAVSKTLLVGAYLEPDREFAMEGLRSGAVRREWVQTWSRYCSGLRDWNERTPSLPDWLVEQGRITEGIRERLEAPLLTTWIRNLRDTREPDARIGDTILVYRVP